MSNNKKNKLFLFFILSLSFLSGKATSGFEFDLTSASKSESSGSANEIILPV